MGLPAFPAHMGPGHEVAVGDGALEGTAEKTSRQMKEALKVEVAARRQEVPQQQTHLERLARVVSTHAKTASKGPVELSETLRGLGSWLVVPEIMQTCALSQSVGQVCRTCDPEGVLNLSEKEEAWCSRHLGISNAPKKKSRASAKVCATRLVSASAKNQRTVWCSEVCGLQPRRN